MSNPSTPSQQQYAGSPAGHIGGPPSQGGSYLGTPGGLQGVQAGGNVEAVNRRPHLYVGSLSPRVTEYMLTEIFAVAGPVSATKIIPDRNFQHGGLNYGFVEYHDVRSAEAALATLNGRKIFDVEIRVNWAYQGMEGGGGGGGGMGGPGGASGPGGPGINILPGSGAGANSGGPAGGAPPPGGREDTLGHFHVFVGDLGPEVNDEALGKAFGAFGTLSEARVMWDMSSGKSRGYGFLAFRDKADAEQAIQTMNGQWLGSRAIRVNWANQKTQTGGGGMGGGFPRPGGGASGGGGSGMAQASGPLDYATVLAQTPAFNTTVYVGNLIPYSTQADLIPLFQGYGYITEIRMQADRGFAFVKLDTHENAANAICNLQNQPVHGRPVKCSWGKDKESSGGGAARPPVQQQQQIQQQQQQQQQQPAIGMPGMQMPPGVGGQYPGMMPQQMYMPPANYGQFGYPYGAYPGSPGVQVSGGSPMGTVPGGVPGGQQYMDPATAAYYQQAYAYYGGQGQGSAQQPR